MLILAAALACRAGAPVESGMHAEPWPAVNAPASAAADSLAASPVTDAPVVDWTAAYRPDATVSYTVRWRYQTPKGEAAGRGIVTIVPPDSVVFSYSAPLGKRGTATFVGLRIVNASPPEDVERFEPFAALALGALGIPWRAGDPRRVAGAEYADPLKWHLRAADTSVTYQRWDTLARDMTTQVVIAGRAIGSSRAFFTEQRQLTRGYMRSIEPEVFLHLEFAAQDR